MHVWAVSPNSGRVWGGWERWGRQEKSKSTRTRFPFSGSVLFVQFSPPVRVRAAGRHGPTHTPFAQRGQQAAAPGPEFPQPGRCALGKAAAWKTAPACRPLHPHRPLRPQRSQEVPRSPSPPPARPGLGGGRTWPLSLQEVSTPSPFQVQDEGGEEARKVTGTWGRAGGLQDEGGDGRGRWSAARPAPAESSPPGAPRSEKRPRDYTLYPHPHLPEPLSAHPRHTHTSQVKLGVGRGVESKTVPPVSFFLFFY